jgi:hypothetical protein
MRITGKGLGRAILRERTVKVVFLDIDGVLNSRGWVEDLGRERGLAHLDPAACARVQRLCDETGAKLVISSTWRVIHKRAAIGDMFRARGLTTTILGMTTALHTERGHEIQAWLDASPGIADLGTLEGMVILDDDLEMAHLAAWHVKTDVERGFTDGELRQAAEVLSRPMPIRG